MFALIVSVVSSLLVGLILLFAPWTTLWESNYLLQPHPGVRSFLLSSFIRGTVSGLGLVNILLAVHEVRQHIGSGGSHG